MDDSLSMTTETKGYNMTMVKTESKTDFLEQLTKSAGASLKAAEMADFSCIASSMFDQYPMSELRDKSLSLLTGMALDWYRVIRQFNSKTPLVEVYNPTIDDNGWESPNTVIVVAHKDMPFLLDSMRLELIANGATMKSVKSTVLTTIREKGELVSLRSVHSTIDDTEAQGSNDSKNEALMYYEIDRRSTVKALNHVKKIVKQSLKKVAKVNKDYRAITSELLVTKEGLTPAPGLFSTGTVVEAKAFVDWLKSNNFTFLGYAYTVLQKDEWVCEKSLGLVDSKNFQELLCLNNHSDDLLYYSKSPIRPNIHRPAYPDYIRIKHYNEQGKFCGEHHFLGLYTARVYRESVVSIPVLRRKVETIYENTGLMHNSYEGKMIRQVLEVFPRDELFQSRVDKLLKTVVAITQINERRIIKLFMRKELNNRFANAIIYIPRDMFSTNLREKILAYLSDAVGAQTYEYYTYFSESLLCRTYIIFRLDESQDKQWSAKALEQKVVELSQSWSECLEHELVDHFGEAQGLELAQRYAGCFPAFYQENTSMQSAIKDLDVIESLDASQPTSLYFYRQDDSNYINFKLFNFDKNITLSEVIPVLENLGLSVLEEHPYRIKKDDDCIFLHDFTLDYKQGNEFPKDDVIDFLEETFLRVWQGDAKNDMFNYLVLSAKLDWREVIILRAYAAYMKQMAFAFSQRAIAQALIAHPAIAQLLIAYFHAQFDPDQHDTDFSERIKDDILSALDKVSNLTEDRIIRRYQEFMEFTLRTNFYQHDAEGDIKPYISFKFSPRNILDIPEPKPLYEIFVYSTRMEGVHLRGGAVARGGLRWSDRSEDYRTEVLGLVKAQQVKNSVIVPNGAKGGFISRNTHASMSRDEFLAEGISCYQWFIKGLLDITDNIVNNKIVPPKQVVRKDGDDAYLVVAADKGTATFSDIANAISAEYQHWLGDAFASGGSQGYDHKGMGITARGAWVSVQRHFKEKGINIQEENFTVVGVGDMAGDVFGNGMLLSEHIQLVAGFNHLHIFIDPNPDAAKSYKERQRLFDLPRSSWQDYSKELISKGGGIFERSAKSITITPEMKARFDIKANKLTPNDLINALLKSPVDLLWNGGIGTYVKASTESNASVGDKANDGLRVNGGELRCKVVGEGGNLGLTQLGRIEYALNGGSCNTDFIDNAAGVDCSDHEVNIKILLDAVLNDKKLSRKQRNQLLSKMTENVAELVLDNNYEQTQAISIAEREVRKRTNEYRRLINHLESSGKLHRSLEFIPSDEEIVDRLSKGQMLTRPELSTLASYVKVELKESLSSEKLSKDDYIAEIVTNAFPDHLCRKYKNYMYNHILRKEIIATQVANDMVNNMGITFHDRLKEATGESSVTIAKSYITAREIFKFNQFRQEIRSLDFVISANEQFELLANMMRRVRRATRWLIRTHRQGLSPGKDISLYQPLIQSIASIRSSLVDDADREEWETQFDSYIGIGLSKEVASILSLPTHLYSGLDVAKISQDGKTTVKKAAQIHYLLGKEFGLFWFARWISDVKVENYWQAISRETFIGELDKHLCTLSLALLRLAGDKYTLTEAIDLWSRQYKRQVKRWRTMMKDLQSSSSTDFAMFSVAMRELLDLTEASQRCKSLTEK